MRTLLLALLLALPAFADFRADLAARFGTPERRLTALGLRTPEPYPLAIFHERYRYQTLWFAIRLHDLVDYRYDRPVDTAVTLDDGVFAPADPFALYEEPEPALAVQHTREGPLVLSRSLPPPPRQYRATRIFKPLAPIPPDVLVGRLDADGWMTPIVSLPSVQDGWRYCLDPFTGAIMRVNRGSAFGPPDGLSPRARTLTARELVLRDAQGRTLAGARLDLGRLPAEPEPILALEFDGARRAVGSSGARERALTAYLRALPGQPVSANVVQFPIQAFRIEGAVIEEKGLRIRASAITPP